jgi:hypothetical protein
MCSKREATVTAWDIQGGEMHLFLSPLFLILLAFIVPRTPSFHFGVVFLEYGCLSGSACTCNSLHTFGGGDIHWSLGASLTIFTVSKLQAEEGWVFKGCGDKAVLFTFRPEGYC